MLGCKGGSERPTVDAIALYLMCLQAQVYPHLSLPPHLIGGKVKVLLTSLDFTPPSTSHPTCPNRLGGGIMGGRGSVLLKHCALRLAAPAHRLTSFGAQP